MRTIHNEDIFFTPGRVQGQVQVQDISRERSTDAVYISTTTGFPTFYRTEQNTDFMRMFNGMSTNILDLDVASLVLATQILQDIRAYRFPEDMQYADFANTILDRAGADVQAFAANDLNRIPIPDGPPFHEQYQFHSAAQAKQFVHNNRLVDKVLACTAPNAVAQLPLNVPVCKVNWPCEICGERGSETAVWARLPCAHMFHLSCIARWAASSTEARRNCPKCRRQYDTLRIPVCDAPEHCTMGDEEEDWLQPCLPQSGGGRAKRPPRASSVKPRPVPKPKPKPKPEAKAKAKAKAKPKPKAATVAHWELPPYHS